MKYAEFRDKKNADPGHSAAAFRFEFSTDPSRSPLSSRLSQIHHSSASIYDFFMLCPPGRQGDLRRQRRDKNIVRPHMRVHSCKSQLLRDLGVCVHLGRSR
jgi:hypothetical protein